MLLLESVSSVAELPPQTMAGTECASPPRDHRGAAAASPPPVPLVAPPALPKTRAKAKPRAPAHGKSAARTLEKKSHESALERLRYELKKSGKEVRKEWSSSTSADKKKWQEEYKSTGSYDFIETLKKKSRLR